MANPTKYYYNTTRFPVNLVGVSNANYFVPPRANTYLTEPLKGGTVVPSGVIQHNLPEWWKPEYWPKASPWDDGYDPYANVRS